jgi:activator of HSP90 ATPase
MKDSFEVFEVIAVAKDVLFNAWLDSEKHTLFTGGEAEIAPIVNGKFTAWDGYIEGMTTLIEPHNRIVQKWRTTEFEDSDEDSILEILLEEVPNGTKITLKHSNIPEGQGDSYKQGWVDHYFEPMKNYFQS